MEAEQKALIEKFNADYVSFKRLECIPLVVAYLVSFLIYYIVFPLIFGFGATLGMKIYHLVYLNDKKKEAKPKHFVVRDVFLFVSSAYNMMIVTALLGQFSLMTVSLFGSFRLLYVCFVSLLLAVSSLIYFLSGKKKEFLNEYASRLMMIDTDLIEEEKIKAVKEEKKED